MMQAELLESIDLHLKIIAYTALTVGSLWTASFVAQRVLKRHDIYEQAWKRSAHDLYEKGKINELLESAEQRLQKYPNNPTALYWKAKSLRRNDSEEELRATIEHLIEEEPQWEEDWMKPYRAPKWD
ncbi:MULTISPECIES: hypothetical protein [unclassified Lentimonas]|uniref:hypothetical protein n=1 Tax=unclassified Lentimonas TaxID=2630993 RepID=UPI00132AF3E5|nr:MULTISPECIES: hypothetical protein [unclassified Lentimonas]CAA6691762.1 Unannotated [Lentimonas sp. CC19]CAA6696332.1 Unannotated [Lentimonas sp. CC10]CAA7071282.1 Unannotated [Lentimonas sp. CC11]